jgi:serine/threonine-protein phosphatase 2B catalytic subunit
VYNNKSAIIKIQDGNFNIKQFNYTHHPYMLPKNMDVFSWSLPFVFEKVQDMLEVIVKKCAMVDEDQEEHDEVHQ